MAALVPYLASVCDYATVQVDSDPLGVVGFGGGGMGGTRDAVT